MILLRIFLALLTMPVLMLLSLNTPKWLEVLVGVGCLGLAVAQIFYPGVTKYLLLSLLVAALAQFLLGTPNNPTSWH